MTAACRDGAAGGLLPDDCLSIRDGRLLVDEIAAGELARRFGTPLYVISETRLRASARRIRCTFQSRWPEGPVNLLASLKANYSLALRRVLTLDGVGCDCFGEGELEVALGSGVAPELVSLNGSVKHEALIERAVLAGVRITLDSIAELELVRAVARRVRRRAVVRLRLRPYPGGIDASSDLHVGEVPVGEAVQAYKAGVPIDDLLSVGADVHAAPELDVSGAMMHIGRHTSRLDVWRAVVEDFVRLVAELRSAWPGWEPRELDVGGGFPAPRDPTGRRLRAQEESIPTTDDYARVITETLRRELTAAGISCAGLVLELEPGRSLYADAGVHLTRVCNVKIETRPVPRRWIETDTSEVFLLDSVLERNRWQVLAVDRLGERGTHEADVVGRSCGFDVIAACPRLPAVEPGDVLAVLDTGAYQDANASNFNAMPRPATVLVNGSTAEIIRRAETVGDVFRRDVVPERLAARR